MTNAASRGLPAYLGRPVVCSKLPSAEALLPQSLQFSVACFYLSRAVEGPEQEKLAAAIQSANPLAAYLCGVGAEALFDRLLAALDVPSGAQPMMTNFGDLPLERSVEEFFSATWPPEERQGEWVDYRILAYCKGFEQVCNRALRFLQTP